jgi:hypothetical protein
MAGSRQLGRSGGTAVHMYGKCGSSHARQVRLHTCTAGTAVQMYGRYGCTHVRQVRQDICTAGTAVHMYHRNGRVYTYGRNGKTCLRQGRQFKSTAGTAGTALHKLDTILIFVIIFYRNAKRPKIYIEHVYRCPILITQQLIIKVSKIRRGIRTR